MKHELEIKEEARKDIIEAADWYASKAPGLNFHFIEQLEIIIKAILNNPRTYKRVYKNFRQAALKKFPYVVVYGYEAERIIIYSVFHAKQHPQKKTSKAKALILMYPSTVYKSTLLGSHARSVKALFSFFTVFLFSCILWAQDSTGKFIQVDFRKDHGDSIYFNKKNKNNSDLRNDLLDIPSPLEKDRIRLRVKLITAANIIGYGGMMGGLYAAWYKNYPRSNFHVFNDFAEWQQVDKFGHVYSAYTLSKLSMELWRWTGIERKKRIWIGGMSGAAYLTVIEILDAYSAEWGWSWGDFGANILGSGMLIAQELAWDEQRIKLKFSFHRKNYNDASLDKRTDELFGKTIYERFLKDYNGQTYWLSANIKIFFPESKVPAWLNISIGTGADGMFGANENIGKDGNGNINFNRTDIKRYRQWYLAPDIDLSKIKTNRKGIKIALTVLNIMKFPMPALEYSNGSFKVKAIGF